MLGESIVLVITPSPYMTIKIQQALDDIGGYKVITCNMPVEALELAKNSTIDTCFLDIFHPDFPVLTVVKELKNKQPEMRIILILSNHGLTHQDIPGIIPDGFLPRTFTTGQLLSALGQAPKKTKITVLSGLQPSHNIPDSPNEQFYQDSDPNNPSPFSTSADFTSLTQRLSDLPIETTALAIIILRRKQLLSQSSKLPYPAIQEIVDLINSFSKTSAKNLQKEITPSHQKYSYGDMIRFIQLHSIQGKYLLYVISLTAEMLLALVFDQDTQFSKVRRQTIQIAQKLIEPQRGIPLEYHPSYLEIREQESSQSIQPAQPEAIIELPKILTTPLISKPQAKPLPDALTRSTPLETEPLESNKQEINTEFLTNSPFSETGIGEMRIESPTVEQANQLGYHDSAELDNEIVGEPLDFVPTGKEQTGQTDSGYESNSVSAPGSFGHYITYSCLLIPRMPQHLLTSNLASYLFKWMGQLCLAYGWRLEHLSIHPNHIQMIAGAPLAISPAFIIRTLRQKTSHYIFTQFPPLTNENPSGDFWAPGFFISGGKQTIQPHLIDRYVSEIREHQGVNYSSPY